MYHKYQQIRPKSQNLDREEILEIYAKIKEWYAEWAQI